jgi:hypothetical protein
MVQAVLKIASNSWIAIAIAVTCLLLAYLLPAFAEERPCFNGVDVKRVDELSRRLDGLGRVVIVSGELSTLGETMKTLNEASTMLRAQARLLAASNAWGCHP